MTREPDPIESQIRSLIGFYCTDQDAFAANRRLVMTSSFLVVHGQIQSESNVIHVVARRFTDLSHRLAELKDEDGPAPQIRNRVSGGLIRSRDFH